MRSVQIIVIGLAVSVLAVACGWLRPSDPQQQRVVEGEFLSLRVNKLGHSDPLPLAPYEYSIDASPRGGKWTEVHRWHQDDPWDVKEIDIKVLDQNVAYFFNMIRYGVTVDGGKTWSHFDIYQPLQSQMHKHMFDHEVPRVEIKTDGTGTIYLQDYYNLDGPIERALVTDNFGQSWNPARQ